MPLKYFLNYIFSKASCPPIMALQRFRENERCFFSSFFVNNNSCQEVVYSKLQITGPLPRTDVNSRIEEIHGTPLNRGDVLYCKGGRTVYTNIMYNTLNTEKRGHGEKQGRHTYSRMLTFQNLLCMNIMCVSMCILEFIT